VQVTHVPPARTKLDIIPSGAHVGSENVRKFIEEKQPNAAICAHVHEARGVDELGKTKIINSGRFPEGYCGLVTVKKEETTTKIVNLI
ncbi:MAG: metallophosphoesterase, partial [Asgard group archaeon]